MKVPSLRIAFSEEDRRSILDRIDCCLRTGQIAQGTNVKEFEESFAEYTGCTHAVAVSSGGAAIEVAMRILQVAGQEVLVPVNTFVATATGVLNAGGRVRFVDVDPATFSISVETLEKAVTRDTKGAIIVHIGGIISHEVEAIRRWCDERGIWLFEDAAHAHGSLLNGKMPGRFGQAAAYSFFATKVITGGEGGMIVIDGQAFADRARGLRDYGKPDPWVSYHTEIGSNWRMPEFCAATALVQLGRLDELIELRERIAVRYTSFLKGRDDVTPVLPSDRSSWYKYVILLPSPEYRDRLMAEMKKRGIGLPGRVYDIPLHRQPLFKNVSTQTFPDAEDICARHLCLPIFAGMTDTEVNYVIEALSDGLALVARS